MITSISKTLSKKLGFACSVVHYQSIDSTMNAARAFVKEQEFSRVAVIIADQQTNGRGQHGRSWEQVEKALLTTIIFKLKERPEDLSNFSKISALTLSNLLEQFGCKTMLKWPNDVLSLDKKKIAGTLIESFEYNNYLYLLVGIGLNLKLGEEKSNIPNATSVYNELGKELEVAEIIVPLVVNLNNSL